MERAEAQRVPVPVTGELPGAFAAAGDLVAAVQQLESGPLWQLGAEALGEVLGLVGWVRHRLGELERHAVAEGVARGLPAEQGAGPVDWLTRALGEHVSAPPPGHAAQVVRLAKAEARARADAQGEGVGRDLAGVFTRLAAGELSVGKADQIVRFHTEVAAVADREALTELTAVLTEGASDTIEVIDPEDTEGTEEWSAGAGERVTRRTRGITDRQLGVAIGRARRLVKPAADLEDEEERYRAGRALFKRPGPAGMAEYRWILDPEGAAIVDAALAGLSGPRPAEDGTPDPRPAARRRADALLDLVARAVSCPDDTLPSAHKAQVVVTITLAELLAGLADRAGAAGAAEASGYETAGAAGAGYGGCGAAGSSGYGGAGAAGSSGYGGAGAAGSSGYGGAGAAGAGTTATGEVLSPGAVRRMACDAEIVPVVLGGPSEPLDVGRTARLFTPAQRKALWVRDGGCTFPGCTAPPQWCEAHHIIHWLLGGLTELSNGALLCCRHHTYVHTHGLTATVTAIGVTWHT